MPLASPKNNQRKFCRNTRRNSAALKRILLLCCKAAPLLALDSNGPLWAQTSVTGSSMAFNSDGSATLTNHAYLGSYLVVPAGGATVNFTVNATKAVAGATPHMNLAVADSLYGFNVTSTSATNYTSSNVFLPQGSYFIRNERDYAGNASTGAFTVNTVSVNTVSGSTATFSNTNTTTNAINAANTYIDNFRKGSATLSLSGANNIPLLAGTPIHVDLARHAFNFGGTVSGTTTGDSVNMLNVTNPAPGTEQNKFQSFINKHFNMIVPSNGGKWAYNEGTQGSVTMQLPDQQLNYAQSHQMRARMHNLIWGDGTSGGNQQPGWVNTLISSAAAGDATAKTNLLNAVNSRINYYVGTNGNRSLKYTEIDGLNEASHEPSYWNIYTSTGGIASIYNQMAAAIAATGSQAKIYLNEFNVLQYSPSSIDSTGTQTGSDAYAKWYRNQVETVRNGEGAVTGIGVQLYANVTQTGSNALSTATMQQALQALSVEGLPLSMTEYGMSSTNQSVGPQAMEDTMRMFFGNPNASTFMIWGWWNLTGGSAPAALLDNSTLAQNGSLTPMGTRWEWLLDGSVNDPLKGGTNSNPWNTDLTVNLGANGTVNFTGFYGDYYLSGQGASATASNLYANYLPFDFALNKGTTSYTKSLAKPPNWYFWKNTGSSTWGTTANWTDAPESGTQPNAAGATAYFGASAVSYNLSTGAATTTTISNPLTVTVSSPVTVGMIVFDRAGSYTLNGSTINLQGYNNANGHVAALYVNNGSHTINSALNLVENTTVTVVPAASTLTVSNLQSTTASLAKAGAGTLSVNVIRANGLTINAGRVRVPTNGTNMGVSVVNTFSIDPAAVLDLNDNDFVVNNGVFSDIQGLVLAGYANTPDPSKTGIISTTGQTAGNTILALFDNASFGVTDWAGQTVGANAIIGKYTYFGDADFNGQVTGDDYLVLDANLDTAPAPGVAWLAGDMDLNGTVTGDDYLVLDANLGSGVGNPLGAAAVPEPAAFAALAAITAALAARRRRD